VDRLSCSRGAPRAAHVHAAHVVFPTWPFWSPGLAGNSEFLVSAASADPLTPLVPTGFLTLEVSFLSFVALGSWVSLMARR
jgi:hypothetical protein